MSDEPIVTSTNQGILVFPLPEEQRAFEIAVKSMDLALAWFDLSQEIRKILKYTDCSDERNDALEEVQKMMYDIERERSLPEVE
jgi:hypothetical protein